MAVEYIQVRHYASVGRPKPQKRKMYVEHLYYFSEPKVLDFGKVVKIITLSCVHTVVSTLRKLNIYSWVYGNVGSPQSGILSLVIRACLCVAR